MAVGYINKPKGQQQRDAVASQAASVAPQKSQSSQSVNAAVSQRNDNVGINEGM